MNKSQIYVLSVMVVGFTKRSRQYWQLQMAARLAVRNKKQAITRGKRFLAKSPFYKPEFSEDLSGKFILSHKCRTLALDWLTDTHTDRVITVTLVRMRRA